MWNTKLLAKGKRVNREFAFISYNTPEEAGNAIRCMHGRYIEGLTKDRDGLTVQYEAQGVGKPGSSQAQLAHQQQQQQQQPFVPPVATQQHFLLHQLQPQQQQEHSPAAGQVGEFQQQQQQGRVDRSAG
jgi:RNA recognition motif-containing protein